ncbi:MAG: TolC family protein [Cyclobacteriaceae bacterium]|nr:TolC family protein [Cyclobacteriaceae bacterium]
MRKHALAICLLLGLSPAFLWAQDVLTLEECTSLARANYPLIKQQELLTKSEEYTLSNANKAYLPQLSVTGIGGYIINGLPSMSLPGQPAPEPDKMQAIALLQLNQTIWDGGATKSAKDMARASTAIEKAYVNVQLYQVQDRVAQIYFGILLIDEQLKVLETSEKNLKLNYDRLRLSNENGLGYRVEVDEVEAELLKVDQRRIEYGYARTAYLDMLSHFLGKPLSTRVALVRPAISEEVLTGANNRPEMIWFSSRTRLSETQSAMERVSLMPKVGLLGAGVFISPGLQFATSKVTNLSLVGLSLSWNTGGLYRNRNNQQLHQIQSDRIAVEQKVFEFNQSLELKQYGAEVAKQRAILLSDTKIVELKARIKQSQQLKFDNGLCSASDLINSINNEQDALSNQRLHEIQLLKSLYAYKTSLGN